MSSLVGSAPEANSDSTVGVGRQAQRSTTPDALRVALLTNEVPPYRVPFFHELAITPGWDFRVFTCVDREVGRLWNVEQDLPFPTRQSYSLSYTRKIRHTDRVGFDETRQIHLPVGLVSDLTRFHPDIVISSEFGARTLIAGLCGRTYGGRVIVVYEGTPHTERNISACQHWLRRSILRLSHGCCVNGRQGRDYLEEIGVPAERIFEIGQATDIDTFLARPEPRDREAMREKLGVQGYCYLFCGALNPRKGADHLLRAWNQFSRKTRADATLLLFGDGTDRAQLEKYVADEGLTNVRFMGHVQRDQLPAVYQAADVFVLSTLEDCWPLAANEAMAAGLPMVSSIYTGSAELIVEDKTGWLVDPLDHDAMARKLELAWDARGRREAMGEAARGAVTAMNIAAASQRVRDAVECTLRTRRGCK
jgi:glycosyltransferase involved in cell wall biosynthesis